MIHFPSKTTCHGAAGRQRRKHAASAFTLIELLVVIAIIAVLASLLVPAVQKDFDQERAMHCLSNLRSLGIAAMSYEMEHDDKLPFPGLNRTYGWHYVLPLYLDLKSPREAWRDGDPVNPTVFSCSVQFSRLQDYWTYGMNVRLNPDINDLNTRDQVLRPGHARNFMSLSPSSLPYFLDGHIFERGRGGYRDWRDSQQGYHGNISPIYWEHSFPHRDGCNVLYMDGHVAHTKRGEGVLNGQQLRYSDNGVAW